MYFTSFLENGKLTIALTGEIDHHCAKAYIQIISSKIEAYMPQVCVLDFHEVTFVDSSGIAVVINALRNMSQIEGKLLLSGRCGCSALLESISWWRYGRRYHEI